MAILVEEENNKSSVAWGNILTWGIIFVILGVAVYYVFFKHPDLVETATPANFQNSVQLSQIHLNPSEVINDVKFKALQSYANPLSPQVPGRSNPFLAAF